MVLSYLCTYSHKVGIHTFLVSAKYLTDETGPTIPSPIINKYLPSTKSTAKYFYHTLSTAVEYSTLHLGQKPALFKTNIFPLTTASQITQ